MPPLFFDFFAAVDEDLSSMDMRARGKNEARHQGRKASVTERIRTHRY